MPRRRGTSVAGMVLEVADDGFFGDPTEWRDVTDGERGTTTAVDELARVLLGHCRWRA